MNNPNRVGKAQSKRVAILRTVAAVAFLVAYFLMKYFDSAMENDPDLSPPHLQILNQAIQLGSPVNGIAVPDSEIGFTLPPGLDQVVQTYDFTFHRTTDYRGFPNTRNWPQSADIVFLGDSLVMGEGVGVENGFVSLVDQALEGKSVVNLGIPGAGLERQYRIFRRFGAGLEPDLVVACLYLQSDLEGDTHFSTWLANPRGRTYNDFRLGYGRRHESQSWLMQRLERHPTFYWIRSLVETHLWGEARILHRLEMPDRVTLLFDRDAVQFAQREFSADEQVFTRLSDSLNRLQSFTDQRDTALVIVLIPGKEEIYAEDVTMKPHSAAGIVKTALERRRIPFLDLYPILKELGKTRTPYFERDIHLNEYGNSVVAEAITTWIESGPAYQ